MFSTFKKIVGFSPMSDQMHSLSDSMIEYQAGDSDSSQLAACSAGGASPRDSESIGTTVPESPAGDLQGTESHMCSCAGACPEVGDGSSSEPFRKMPHHQRLAQTATTHLDLASNASNTNVVTPKANTDDSEETTGVTDLSLKYQLKFTEIGVPLQYTTTELDVPLQCTTTELDVPLQCTTTELGVLPQGASAKIGVPLQCTSTEQGVPPQGTSTEQGVPPQGATASTEIGVPLQCTTTEQVVLLQCTSTKHGVPPQGISTEQGVPPQGASTENGVLLQCTSSEQAVLLQCTSTEQGMPPQSTSTEQGVPPQCLSTEEGVPPQGTSTEICVLLQCSSTEQGVPPQGTSTTNILPEVSDQQHCHSINMLLPPTTLEYSKLAKSSKWNRPANGTNKSKRACTEDNNISTQQDNYLPATLVVSPREQPKHKDTTETSNQMLPTQQTAGVTLSSSEPGKSQLLVPDERQGEALKATLKTQGKIITEKKEYESLVPNNLAPAQKSTNSCTSASQPVVKDSMPTAANTLTPVENQTPAAPSVDKDKFKQVASDLRSVMSSLPCAESNKCEFVTCSVTLLDILTHLEKCDNMLDILLEPPEKADVPMTKVQICEDASEITAGGYSFCHSPDATESPSFEAPDIDTIHVCTHTTSIVCQRIEMSSFSDEVRGFTYSLVMLQSIRDLQAWILSQVTDDFWTNDWPRMQTPPNHACSCAHVSLYSFRDLYGKDRGVEIFKSVTADVTMLVPIFFGVLLQFRADGLSVPFFCSKEFTRVNLPVKQLLASLEETLYLALSICRIAQDNLEVYDQKSVEDCKKMMAIVNGFLFACHKVFINPLPYTPFRFVSRQIYQMPPYSFFARYCRDDRFGSHGPESATTVRLSKNDMRRTVQAKVDKMKGDMLDKQLYQSTRLLKTIAKTLRAAESGRIDFAKYNKNHLSKIFSSYKTESSTLRRSKSMSELNFCASDRTTEYSYAAFNDPLQRPRFPQANEPNRNENVSYCIQTSENLFTRCGKQQSMAQEAGDSGGQFVPDFNISMSCLGRGNEVVNVPLTNPGKTANSGPERPEVKPQIIHQNIAKTLSEVAQHSAEDRPAGNTNDLVTSRGHVMPSKRNLVPAANLSAEYDPNIVPAPPKTTSTLPTATTSTTTTSTGAVKVNESELNPRERLRLKMQKLQQGRKPKGRHQGRVNTLPGEPNVTCQCGSEHLDPVDVDEMHANAGVPNHNGSEAALSPASQLDEVTVEVEQPVTNKKKKTRKRYNIQSDVKPADENDRITEHPTPDAHPARPEIVDDSGKNLDKLSLTSQESPTESVPRFEVVGAGFCDDFLVKGNVPGAKKKGHKKALTEQEERKQQKMQKKQERYLNKTLPSISEIGGPAEQPFWLDEQDGRERNRRNQQQEELNNAPQAEDQEDRRDERLPARAEKKKQRLLKNQKKR